MKKINSGILKNILLFTTAILMIISGIAQSAPELIFKNPVLKSGQANRPGAVYRFNNVAPGVDAEIKLKKFSKSSIVMSTIDNNSVGWDKAFQPEFGIPGWVGSKQNWYIDFELTFYKAGQNVKQKMEKVVLTTLDVDGDGYSISEYAILNGPSEVAYSTLSYLQGLISAVANVGELITCQSCGGLSLLLSCNHCGGDGLTNRGSGNNNECEDCEGSGKVQALCGHPYLTPNIVYGPVENFTNIDTLATQVMATYTYLNKDKITFRYGAKSGNHAVYGSGVRLNSMWFKSFNLASQGTLPVKLTEFKANYVKGNVDLGWTGHEENFSHYVLQRSSDGKEFKDVATIFATGNNLAATNYNYKDRDVSSASGILFYRLMLVDKMQQGVQFSDVRIIKLNDGGSAKLLVYPNPVKDQLRITIPSSWQDKPAIIELISSNGRIIQAIQLKQTSQTEHINLGNLPKGFYLVRVTCNGENAQQSIIKN